MSNNTVVVNTLLAKRDTLVSEKRKMIQQFNSEIVEIENAIETLTGDRPWQAGPSVIYDDQNPDYIKASAEEI
jgi:hypothetical protein